MKICQLCCFTALLRIFLAALLLPVAVTLPGSRDTLTAAETKKEKKKSSKQKKKKSSKNTVKPLLPKETSFDWKSAKEIYPGILYAERKTVSPRPGRFYFVRVDVSTPRLSFRTNGRAENWGKPMPDFPKRPIRTKRITVRSFLDGLREEYARGKSGFNAVLAVNASPWGPWTSPFTHVYADPPGINISNGEIVSRRGKEGHAFIQYKDGKVDLKTVNAKDPVDDIKLALSGFAFILRNGEVIKNSNNALHPRTVFGISKDKRYLYILVVDGRQPKVSLGCSYEELAQWLIYLGAYDGINMDGGGSTTLAVARRKKGKSTLMNRPAGGGERKVATVLGIGYETE